METNKYSIFDIMKRTKVVELVICLVALLTTTLLVAGKISGFLQGEWFLMILPILYVVFGYCIGFIIRYALSKTLG